MNRARNLFNLAHLHIITLNKWIINWRSNKGFLAEFQNMEFPPPTHPLIKVTGMLVEKHKTKQRQQNKTHKKNISFSFEVVNEY